MLENDLGQTLSAENTGYSSKLNGFSHLETISGCAFCTQMLHRTERELEIPRVLSKDSPENGEFLGEG